MQDIERLCKRIIIINHGEIIYDGYLEQIKDKYLKEKVIDVKFESKKTNFKLKGCKILEKTKYEIKIELDLEKNSIKNLVNYLLTNFEIVDINVQDPAIEEIIKIIYKNV